jgi:hypothetical protein
LSERGCRKSGSGRSHPPHRVSRPHLRPGREAPTRPCNVGFLRLAFSAMPAARAALVIRPPVDLAGRGFQGGRSVTFVTFGAARLGTSRPCANAALFATAPGLNHARSSYPGKCAAHPRRGPVPCHFPLFALSALRPAGCARRKVWRGASLSRLFRIGDSFPSQSERMPRPALGRRGILAKTAGNNRLAGN